MSEFGDTIEHLFSVMLSSVYTCLPAKIETYDFKQQKASVKPLIKKAFLDGDIASQPVITDVPVIFPRSQNSGMTFPLESGDGVLLVFAQRDISSFLNSGQDSESQDPRRFDISDAIAIAGLFSFNQKNIASNGDDLEIQHYGQKVTITKDGDIKLGVSSLKKLVNESFLTAFDAHTHTVPIIGAVGVTPTTPPLVGSLPIHITSKVEAE